MTLKKENRIEDQGDAFMHNIFFYIDWYVHLFNKFSKPGKDYKSACPDGQIAHVGGVLKTSPSGQADFKSVPGFENLLNKWTYQSM